MAKKLDGVCVVSFYFIILCSHFLWFQTADAAAAGKKNVKMMMQLVKNKRDDETRRDLEDMEEYAFDDSDLEDLKDFGEGYESDETTISSSSSDIDLLNNPSIQPVNCGIKLCELEDSRFGGVVYSCDIPCQCDEEWEHYRQLRVDDPPRCACKISRLRVDDPSRCF